MEQDILITGAGILCSIGNNVDEVLDSFEKHKSGIEEIAFLSTKHKGEIPVGEIKIGDEELAGITGLNPKLSRTILVSFYAIRQAMMAFPEDVIEKYRTGLISATTVGGMDKAENFFEEYLEDPDKGNLMDVLHHDCGKATDYVAKKLGIHDFVTTISTACSSSANAIMLGARLIKSNRIDIAIVGGVDVLTRYTVNGFNSLMLLDKEQCRPLDASRAGLNLGEGAAYLVLMNRKIAESLNAEIFCKLSGYCNANDSHHQTALSENGQGPFLAIEGALKMAGITPSDVDYINMHGTGTMNNDSAEGKAVERIFHAGYPKLSATKSFTGHTLGASGAMEAVFSAVSIKRGVIYPNYSFSKPVDGLSIRPETVFQKGVNVKNVLSNSFGFGGNCTSLLFSKN